MDSWLLFSCQLLPFSLHDACIYKKSSLSCILSRLSDNPKKLRRREAKLGSGESSGKLLYINDTFC